MRKLRPLLLSLLVISTPVAAAAAQGMSFRGGDRMVTIVWGSNYDSVTTFRVFRGTDSTSAGTDISGVLTRTNTFVDKTLTPGTLYFYSLEIKTPRAGPKPIRTPGQRFTLAKTPVPLPKRP